MVGGVDCLLQRRGGAAGQGASVGDLRVLMPGSTCCKLGQEANMGRCARVKEVERGQKEEASSLGGARIGRRWRLVCGPSACDSTAASR
jgi:hypothetical protein